MASSSSPKQKKRRLCVFRDEWLEDADFKEWIARDSGKDPSMVRCKSCNCSFSVRTDGACAVRKHMNSDKHKLSISSRKQSETLNKFFINVNNTTEQNQVAAAELSMTYHGVQHQHSYLSQDCGNKLTVKLFCDSKLSKKFHCGRTKCEAIVENVLGPHSVQQVLLDLERDKPFSLSTDASNKGNVKLYPVSLRYFCEKKGVVDRLLDFYEDSDETSDGIFNKLSAVLKENNLKLENVVSYGADNASVNYGKHHSVYTNLKAKQPLLLKANCNCHVLHNAAKHACKQLKYDVEGLVIKTFNEFSSSAKNVHELKGCFEFVEEEYSVLLRHVAIRWLSLEPAIARLIKCWKAIKIYFIGEGEGETPKLVWSFIKDQENGLLPDDELSLQECYIHFVHNFMGIFSSAIKTLETKTTQVTEVYNIMDSVRLCIKMRLEDKFFSAKVNECLKLLPDSEQKSFKNEACNVYQRAMEYLEKWFPYETSPLKKLSILSLKDVFLFDDLMAIVREFGIKIDGDALYNEYCTLKQVIIKLKDIPEVDKRWLNFFQTCEAPNLKHIVEFVLCIPISNANVERVFSLMKNLWYDERNRMRPELVKAELCVKVNYAMTCGEFIDYVSTNKELLKACRSEQKYSFKRK